MNKIEAGKFEKYKVLKHDIIRTRPMKEVIVILVLVGALGIISTDFEKYTVEIEIEMRLEHAQKTALLVTLSFFRLVLGC